MYIDLAIGLGIPLSSMVIMFFVQGHRFDIWEGYGPWPAIPNTYLQMVFGNGESLLLGCVSAFFCSTWLHRSNRYVLLTFL